VTFIRRSPRSAAPVVRRTGFIDVAPRSDRGVWIRQREGIAPLFASFSDNPAVHQLDNGTRVEFEIEAERGHSVAVNVTPTN
jgi:cold shock CspA family protein